MKTENLKDVYEETVALHATIKKLCSQLNTYRTHNFEDSEDSMLEWENDTFRMEIEYFEDRLSTLVKHVPDLQIAALDNVIYTLKKAQRTIAGWVVWGNEVTERAFDQVYAALEDDEIALSRILTAIKDVELVTA